LDKPLFLPGAIRIIPKMLENTDPVYWLAVQNMVNTFESGQRLHDRGSREFNLGDVQF
jgi:hypothetical protein